MSVAYERYKAKSNGPSYYRCYFNSLNFVMSRIILPINQFEIKPCLLINELQDLNQAITLMFGCAWIIHKTLNNCQYGSNLRMNVTFRIQVNSHAFRFYKHPTSTDSIVSPCSKDLRLRCIFHAMIR